MTLGTVLRWHYAGVFLLLCAEEAGVPLPVPGDVFIAALGAAARTGHAQLGWTVLTVLGATLAGSAVLFELSRRMGRPMLLRIGRRFHFDAARADRVEDWLWRRGAAAVVIGRLIPGLRIVLTVAAGALGMERRTFFAGTAVASVVWAGIYYALGYTLGAAVVRTWPSVITRVLRDPETASIGGTALVVGTLLALGRWAWRRQARRGVAPLPVDTPGERP